MPELPEVETVVRGLQMTVLQKEITDVETLHAKPLVNASPLQLKRFLKQEVISSVRRRGKYIFFCFKSGKLLVVHLRMTGKFIFLPPAAAPSVPPGGGKNDLPEQPRRERTHIRIVIHFKDRSELLYQDVRIFGTFKIYAAGQPVDEEQKIGVDPFDRDLTPEWLVARLVKRQLPLKVVLLDQKLISGLGNIYVCEALHEAGLSPFLPANRLNLKQAESLITSIRNVLKRALKHGGTTINDFSHIDEKSGGFQKLLKVYQKQGECCTRCGKALIRVQKLAQRSTFYCPVCQPED